LRRRFPEIPLLCDPSHIGGKRELVMTLSQQALDLNFDGLMIETHSNPQCALSDSRQQVTPDELMMIAGRLVLRSAESPGEEFLPYRRQIDAIDLKLVELLEKRMELSREIGLLKRDKGLTVYRPTRYNEVLEHCAACCDGRGLDADAVKGIFEMIHSESIRQQLDIINEGTDNGTALL
jgi:chorismate mutase